jgi:probable rRNA maturation factor
MFEKGEIKELSKYIGNAPEVLGDIVISIDRVKEQAEEYGHSFERELSYMVVHGFYHIMGEDHIEEADKIVMREKEEYVLNKLNIKR